VIFEKPNDTLLIINNVILKLFAASYEEPSLRARRSQCSRGDSFVWERNL